jgi:hypothetical protein
LASSREILAGVGALAVGLAIVANSLIINNVWSGLIGAFVTGLGFDWLVRGAIGRRYE